MKIKRQSADTGMIIKMKKMIIVSLSIPVLCVITLAINYFLFQRKAVRVPEGIPLAQSDTVEPALMVIDVQEGTTGGSSSEIYHPIKYEASVHTINRAADS